MKTGNGKRGRPGARNTQPPKELASACNVPPGGVVCHTSDSATASKSRSTGVDRDPDSIPDALRRPEPLVDVAVAEEFLELLAAPFRNVRCPPLFRAIVLLHRNGRTSSDFYEVASEEQRHNLLASLNATDGDITAVCFGIGVLGHEPEHGRGTADDVVAASCFVADVDGKNFGALDECREFITKRLADLGLEPTAIVASGHGYHVYFVLEEPWLLRNDPDRTAFRQKQRSLAEELRGDHILDPSRVMRLPGTVNRKDDAKPVPCEVLELNPESLFSIEDIDALPAVSDAVLDGEYELDDDLDDEEHERVYALLRRYARVNRRVRSTVLSTKLTCASESEQDFAIMCALFELGFTARQGVHIARHQRLQRDGERPGKVSRLDYWERTAAAALDRVG